MRAVVDTNVFVSAALKDTSLPSIALHHVVQRGTLLKSAATEAQFHEVVSRPYLASLIAPAMLDWLKSALSAAELVAITESVTLCRDPTDDKFLELAVSGRADFILTGDNDLLVLGLFRGTRIVAPATFLRTVAL
ncbi:MAG TPA: putative toxin-antitoxin system toxin component, PIN family [Acetobacteraceae bacterium]|nr:putative toxin-antitoxin system toxin component, PIN family [Acetobacteraceae bacterium]